MTANPTRSVDDDELVESVRHGHVDSYGTLFARHAAVARHVATRHGPAAEAEDVVAEVYARVLAQIRRGRGPTTSFRAYLLTAVRHEAVRRSAASRRHRPLGDLESRSQSDEPSEAHDRVRDAYAALPPRWRHTLWQLEVEGRRPHELASELGISANAVAALGYRARIALRSAYLGGSQAA